MRARVHGSSSASERMVGAVDGVRHVSWKMSSASSAGLTMSVSCTSAPPLPIRWIGGLEDLKTAPLPSGPVVFFSDTFDQREADVVAWVEETRGPCDTTTYGGPAFGVVITVACP